MTKEELEKEARKYVKQNYCEMCVIADDCKSGCIDCFTVQAYLAGAELREKRIAELIDLIHAERKRQEQCDDIHLRKIADLEKENAELKKKVENLQKYLDTRNCYRECAETWLKLTEAKKLLKQFLEAKNSEDTYKAEWEAEQFLNSEVEK